MADFIPIDNPEQTVHRRFEHIASLMPDHEALRFGNESLTYGELDRQSGILADAIIRKRGDQKGNIAFLLETGLKQIIAILGVLKSGNTYVALDTNFPAERNVFMMKDADCDILLSNNMNLAQAREFSRDITLLNLDDIDFSASSPVASKPASAADNAVLLYTSGSTGTPKGVVWQHRGIVHYIKRFSNVIRITPDDRFAFFFSISFSAHTMPIITALLNGATLHIFDLKSRNFREFADFILKDRISLILMIPSVLRQFLAILRNRDVFPDLRILLLGGETLYRGDIEKLWKHLTPKTRIINLYASTEALFSRYYLLKHNSLIKGNIVPIGYEVEGVEIILTDENGERKDPNKLGELRIKSNYIATGYWKNAEISGKDFLRDPDDDTVIFRSSDLGYKQSDGCIVHVGRSDSMVKLRGYRIDLGEIENIMIQNKEVKETVVTVKENPFGTKHIIAYVVPRGEKNPDPNYLKLAVNRMLPNYMVPSYIINMESLPKNAIGKVDKKALPDPEWDKHAGSSEITEPRSANEEELKEIFERILEVSPISIDDNILNLGADSLRLFVAFDEIEKRFGIKLNIDAVLETPTIEKIALQIDRSNNTD